MDEIEVLLGDRNSDEDSGIAMQKTRAALLDNWNTQRAGEFQTYIIGMFECFTI